MRLNDSGSFAFGGIGTSLSIGGVTDYYQANMIFAMATAPTGWVKQTANTDYALRIVGSGTPGGGGTSPFSTVYASVTASGTVPAPVSANVMPALGSTTIGGVTLCASQLPPHTHSIDKINGGGPLGAAMPCGFLYSPGTGSNIYPGGPTGVIAVALNPTGTAGPHTHGASTFTTSTINSFTGNSTSLAIQYIDNIIAQYSK